jgi:sterol 22-desaturase
VCLESRDIMRTLNQQTSQTVFVGPYLDDPSSFGKWYLQMTDGFLSLPVYFPGTALWNAVRAREKVVATLSKAAKQSKALMADAAGKGQDAIESGTAKCLLDFWAVRINELIAEAAREGRAPDHFTSDWAMGDSMMDFLFASQVRGAAAVLRRSGRGAVVRGRGARRAHAARALVGLSPPTPPPSHAPARLSRRTRPPRR